MLGALIIGFLYALLYCAIIILIAFAFVWGLSFIGVAIDGNVMKWGKVVVGLLCVIVMLSWLLGALGLGGGLPNYFRHSAITDRPDATARHYAAQDMPGMLRA